MTANSSDSTIEGRLDYIADAFETLTGNDPGQLRKDHTIPAILKRIGDNIVGGAFEAHDLGDHLNVTATSPSDGDFLRYDSTLSAWINDTMALNDATDVTLTSPSSAHVLRHDGSEWVNSLLALDDLSDTTLSSPGSAEFLRHDGTDWKNAALVLGDLPAISLSDLSDTLLPTLIDGKYLRYSSGDAAWINGGITLVSNIDDVNIGVAATGQFLQYNGALWENVYLNLNDAIDVTISSPSNLDLLQYDSVDARWENRTIASAFDPTYVRRDGTTALTGNWDAGAFTIEADKIIAQRTTQGGVIPAAYDTADFGFDITTTGNDVGNTYRGIYVDHDYVLDNVLHIGTPTIYGIEADIAISGAGTYGSRNFYGYAVKMGIDGQTAPAYVTAPIGIHAVLKGDFAGNIYGCYAKAEQASATGIAYGFQGYGQNSATGATGERAVGLLGFAQTTSGIAIGVQGRPFLEGTSKFAFYAPLGHNHFNAGVTYFYTGTTIQTAATTTHINPAPANDQGSVYIQKYLEVDGVAYFDGGSLHIDNAKAKFGTGNDVEIYYDSANMNIDTDLVAASDLVIDCGTAKTLLLEVPVWKDINLGAAMLAIPASSNPDKVNFVDEAGADTGIVSYGFAVDEYVCGSFELQHDYKEGTDLTFHVHWQGSAAPTGTDKVQWQLIYTVAQSEATLDATTTIAVETDYDTQYEFKLSSFPAITGTNFNIGDQFLFTLKRIDATADEYGGDAIVATVGIHYQVDTMGSRAIAAK